ncbi:MAG: hypothetical protein IIZ68_08575 [Clostridia bacterium]|nr:hypothetical protein [Clostridia bacterium]MBQ5544344.1 hypothetical protein [Clostridia bacterium]
MDGWNPEEFEAEISRRLEEEHKRRAEEKAAQTEVASTEEDFSLAPLPETDNDMTVSETTSAGEETPVSPVTSASTEVSSEEAPPVRIKTGGKYSAELSTIMQEESVRQQQHSAAGTAHTAESVSHVPDESPSEEATPSMAGIHPLPLAVRVIFTALLLIGGGVGIFLIATGRYVSLAINALCFMASAGCLLGALGLHTAGMANRLLKALVMKLGALALFGYYCLYALRTLGMTVLIHGGVGKIDWLTVAREGIDYNVPKDVAALGYAGMAEVAAFVVPFAFFLLLLVRPLRNVGVYFCVMPLVLIGAGTLRVITHTGMVSLAHCVICLVGAAAAYFLFMLPPLQNIMRRSALIGWARVFDDDD